MLSLALVAGLGAAAPAFSVAAAQDAPAQEAASFDEALLDVPENESADFYRERMAAINDGLRALSVSGDRDALQAILPKLNDAMKLINKKLAFSEVEDSFNYFRTYTLGVAREGNIDELAAILADETAKPNADKDRVGWVNYLFTCVSLDKAGEDAARLDAAIEALEKLQATDDMVASRVEEFSAIIKQYDADKSAAYIKRTLEAFSNSDNKLRKSVADNLLGAERFMNLVGNDMVVDGVFLGGEEIDWAAYRGKVVLVDFWATWCGPCVNEVPNVLALYEKYHEAGFDVIGYSLDDDLEALESFEKERKLPWKTASRKLSMQANEKDGKEYTNLTAYYGIRSIPTMVLVGKDGKVLDTHARGDHLKELLEEAFPEVK